jgi:hypothetical protein
MENERPSGAFIAPSFSVMVTLAPCTLFSAEAIPLDYEDYH